MYDSPINCMFHNASLMEQLDEEIMKAVVKAEITVDKEELIKALAYDRNQYQKGYDDGYNLRMEELKNERN